MGREILGELAVPIGERRAQREPRHRGVDDVVDASGSRASRPGAGIAVAVGVPPPADHPRRQRHQSIRGQHIEKLVRRVVTGRVMLGDPAQAAGQTEDRLAVGQ